MSQKIGFKRFLLTLLIVSILVSSGFAEFKIQKVSDRILSLINSEDGAIQHLILTKKGMVVLDSFWSNTTAKKFKKQWIEKLKRDDFIYNINTVDRLDLFGGNSLYKDITIIGHQSFLNKFKQPAVDEEIDRLAKMWRQKEEISRKRLATHKPGSQAEKGEKRWLNTCKNRADELEQAFSLQLPNLMYKDQMMLDLGDLTLHLIHFGKAGYDGMTILLIPEEETVFIPGFILHSQHLAPNPFYKDIPLDVPRWIKVLNQVLNGKYPAKKVICGMGSVWTRERALTHLNYITTLWSKVNALAQEGKNLEEVLEICSLENEFAFVKDIQVYKVHGDEWVRPQHKSHVKGFFYQTRKLGNKP